MDDRIADQLDDLNALLERIPPEHRGVLFERVLESFHPQENTRRLERAFALLWAERNSESGGNLLVHLLHPYNTLGKGPDTETRYLPRDEREWRIACLVAATIIQWLPTTVGCSFLREAFKNAGGKLTCELPDTADYQPPRR